MSMEKYGVANVADQQTSELKQVRTRKAELGATHEKTADDTQELERLSTRESELKEALAQQ